MAEDLELIIRAVDQASVNIDAITKRLSSLEKQGAKAGSEADKMWKQIVGGVTVSSLVVDGVNMLKQSLQDAFAGAMEAEQINVKLMSALKATGDTSETTVGQIDALANNLATLAGIDDDAAKSAYTLGLQLGFTNEQLKGVIPGAQGLATAFGVDLESAVRMVAQAEEGNFGQLQRLIPELRSAKTEAEKLDIVYREMAKGIEMSSDQMETSAGRLTNWKNQVANEMESLAGSVIKAGDAIAGLFGSGAEKALREQAVAAHREQIAVAQKLAAANLAQKQAAEAAEKADGDAVKAVNAALQGQAKIREEAAKTATSAAKERAAEMKREVEAVEKAQRAYEDLVASLGWGAGRKIPTDQDPFAATNLDERIAAMKEYEKILASLGGKAVPDFSDQEKKAADATDKMNVSMKDASALAQALGDALYMMGVDGNSGILQAVDGLGMMAQGLDRMGDAKNLLQSVTAGFGLLGSAVTIVTGIIDLFAGDGIGEAMDRENRWMGVNADLQESIRKLAEEMGSTHAATSQYLDQIIEDTDISIQSFDDWTLRLRGILSDLDQGKMTSAETTKEIGDAFTQLIAKAKILGTEGSREMLNMFSDLGGRGLAVDEIQEYMAESIKAGLAGYEAMKKVSDTTDLKRQYEELYQIQLQNPGTDQAKQAALDMVEIAKQMDGMKAAQAAFGGLNIEVYDKIIAHQKKIAENQGLVDGIKGASEALRGLSATTQISEQDYQAFEDTAANAYNQLILQGFTGKEALQQLAPMLGKLSFLQGEFGYAIDETTLSLIQQAKDAGISMEGVTDPQQQMVDLMGELVDIFKNAFPSAVDESVDAVGRLADTVGGLGRAVGNVGDIDITGGYNFKQPDDIAAADGFSGWVNKPTRFLVGEAGPEYVNVSPTGKGGSKTEITFNVNGVTSPEIVAEHIKTAWRGNIRQVRSTIMGN
jgi:predicted transcriptional regulator